jgi:hypothetical protein
MEPVEVLGIAGVAAAGWALGRASRGRREGAPDPGERIATIGSDMSRRAAFSAASVGSRALLVTAAGVSVAGSLAARGVGAATDAAITAGDTATRLVRRGRSGEESQPTLMAETSTPQTAAANTTAAKPAAPQRATSKASAQKSAAPTTTDVSAPA